MAKNKGSLEVAGKTFKFTDDESELRAYKEARLYLRDLQREAAQRMNPGAVVVSPAPATARRTN